MVSLNKVIIAGNLTRKPEIRKTPTGSSVTDLLVALNRDYTNANGEKLQDVCFVDVVVWGKLAVLCCEVLDKSSTILVEGRLQLDTWFSRDREKRCKLRVAAEKIQFLDKRSLENQIKESELAHL
jgi:single-strand DNA-binding protein